MTHHVLTITAPAPFIRSNDHTHWRNRHQLTAAWRAVAALQARRLPAFGAGPVHVSIEFRIQRPKSHYRTGRYAHLLKDDAPDFVITTPDVDKACRSTLDALTQARVITDDKLVARLIATKVYCDRTDPAGATVMVRPLTAPARAVA